MLYSNISLDMELKMRALLIVNQGGDKDVKVIVRLQAKTLIRQVNRLMLESNGKEAFNILLKKAEVEGFIPPGRKVSNVPELIFVRDVL